MRQVAYVVAARAQAGGARRVLDMESPTSALVFCRTRLEVDALVETLNAHGYRAEALHGGMQQQQRDRGDGPLPRAARPICSIATDVAARGLDIEQLSHVVNYDVPVGAGGRTSTASAAPAAPAARASAITLAEPREHRLLRDHRAGHEAEDRGSRRVPTVADLRARRLELTRASLRERSLAGDLDDVRVVVESLAEEFDIVDVAAAAVKLAHDAAAGADGEEERRSPRAGRAASRSGARGARAADRGAAAAARATGPGDHAALHRRGPRARASGPRDLVGAITNEAGIASRDLGAIEIADRFSLVEVPEARPTTSSRPCAKQPCAEDACPSAARSDALRTGCGLGCREPTSGT